MTILLKYSIKSDSCLSNIPPTLRELLNFACQEKYEELYEKNAGKISLDDMCLKILNNLKDKDELLTQKRYLYMALIMADAVEPTIKKKLHKDNRSQKVFQLINYLLIQKKVNNNLLDQKKLIAKIEKDLEKLFPEISFGLQEIDEAFDVFKNLVKTLVLSLTFPVKSKIQQCKLLEALSGKGLRNDSLDRKKNILKPSSRLSFKFQKQRMKGV